MQLRAREARPLTGKGQGLHPIGYAPSRTLGLSVIPISQIHRTLPLEALLRLALSILEGAKCP